MTEITNAAGAAAAVTEAVAAASATEASPAPAQSTPAAVSDSTPASESTSAETSQSLLSSASGPKPEQPAPAEEAKPAAKAAETPPPAKDGETPVKADDPAKTDGKADAATDPAKDATAIAPPAPVSIEDFKLPEGAKFADEPSKAFLEILNKADLDQKQRGQGLLDLHISEMGRVADEMAKHQRKVWDDTNAGWKEETRKEFGNRLDTALATGKAVIEEFGKDRAARLMQFLDYTGAGNHPDVIWFFDQIGQKFNVFENSIVPSNPKAPPSKGPGNRGWYDNSLNKSP